MNKMRWNSVKPDGGVPNDLLKDLLDKSNNLVLADSVRRHRRKELETVFAEYEIPMQILGERRQRVAIKMPLVFV